MGWAHGAAHISRAWGPDPFVDECPCEKAPCGLVVSSGVDPACPQHAIGASKTIRANHTVENCPDGEGEK